MTEDLLTLNRKESVKLSYWNHPIEMEHMIQICQLNFYNGTNRRYNEISEVKMQKHTIKKIEHWSSKDVGSEAHQCSLSCCSSERRLPSS